MRAAVKTTAPWLATAVDVFDNRTVTYPFWTTAGVAITFAAKAACGVRMTTSPIDSPVNAKDVSELTASDTEMALTEKVVVDDNRMSPNRVGAVFNAVSGMIASDQLEPEVPQVPFHSPKPHTKPCTTLRLMTSESKSASIP